MYLDRMREHEKRLGLGDLAVYTLCEQSAETRQGGFGGLRARTFANITTAVVTGIGPEINTMGTGSRKLQLARRHLDRVLAAWTEPTDWDDLSLYGFYCLEAALEAAALHFGLRTSKKHWEKVDLAVDLHKKNELPDISDLLRDLNDARKAAAYGDVARPDLDAEDIASQIEQYVDAVAAVVAAENGEE